MKGLFLALTKSTARNIKDHWERQMVMTQGKVLWERKLCLSGWY